MKRLVLGLLGFSLLMAACAPSPKPAATPVLFIGLDGADWQLLDVYMERGLMPNLAALAREGRTGVLTTLNPPLSPLVWTTMMTGVSPLEHGILDFTRINPGTGAEEPITRAERRVPAIWDMAAMEGRTVAVFGMWATWPAEPMPGRPGLMVADRFFSFTSKDSRPPPGIVHPPGREAWARETLARVETETGFEALKTYLPWLDRASYEEAAGRPDPYAHPVSALRRILIETRAYDALARSWLEKETPGLTVLYFQGTDTIGHIFAELSEEDAGHYGKVPELYFAEVDRLLGEYRKLAEKRKAVLMIASDHGFRWGADRPRDLGSARAATAGLWHRDEGVYLLWGPGISPGARERGRVDQVCATLLDLLGLPQGKGIAGPPLPGAPKAGTKTVDYRSRWHPAPLPEIEAGGEEEIAKLRSLGYLGPGGSGRAVRGETRTAASYNNEGLLLKDAGRAAEAAKAFQKALGLQPDSASALWNLSDLLCSRGDLDRSDELLIRALGAGLPDGVGRVLSRAHAYDADRRLRLLTGATAIRPEEPRLLLARGQILFEHKECRQALSDFEEAARLAPGEALAFNGVGLASLCLGDPEGAASAFSRSLEIRPDQPEIREALGQLGG